MRKKRNARAGHNFRQAKCLDEGVDVPTTEGLLGQSLCIAARSIAPPALAAFCCVTFFETEDADPEERLIRVLVAKSHAAWSAVLSQL